MKADVVWGHIVVWVGVLGWHLYLWLVKLGIVRPPKDAKFKLGGTMQLQAPFDFQVLVEELKKKGLVDAEKVAKDVLTTTFDWLNSSVQLEVQKIPLLAVAIPVLNNLEQRALEAVDKIDGQPG